MCPHPPLRPAEPARRAVGTARMGDNDQVAAVSAMAGGQSLVITPEGAPNGHGPGRERSGPPARDPGHL